VAGTAFVGRGKDLARVESALERSVLVTLLGPPGVGKTRLAHELVAKRSDAVFCDLTEARTAEAMTLLVARAIDLPPTVEPTPAAVADQLRKGTTLVVLDNFEQLAAVAAPVVSLWVDPRDAHRILVTSRHRLAVPVEHVVELEPLGGADGRALFVDRALAHGFTPDAAIAEAIARRLDGLPLAIELGAARLRVLSPEQLLERIERDVHVVAAVPGAEHLRPGGLLASIAGSWDLLEPWARQALARCSVFTGSFDLDAAEAVVADLAGGSVLDALQHLRDRSLLALRPVENQRARYGILVSIREWARARLEEDDAQVVRRRWVDHYVALAQRHVTAAESGDPVARAFLATDVDNLLALVERGEGGLVAALALAASGALPYSTAHTLLDRALVAEGDPLLRARALEARATQRRFLGRLDESIADLQEVERTAAADRALRTRALMGLGNAETVRVRWAAARAWFSQALALAEEATDAATVGRIVTLVAATLYNEDRLREAADHLEAALATLREVGDRTFEGRAAASLGVVHLSLGDVRRARAYLEEAMAVHAAANDPHWAAVTGSYLGALAQEEGALVVARDRLAIEAARLRALGVRRAEAVVLFMAAGCALEMGDDEAVVQLVNEALPLSRRLCPDHEPLLRSRLAVATLRLGRRASAVAAFETAFDLPLERAGFAAARAIDRGHLLLSERTAHGEVERLLTPVVDTFETRLSVRVLGRALAAARADLALRDRPRLAIERGAGWFVPPGETDRVELYRRKPLRRLLQALAEHAETQPGRAMPIADLVRAGWPGESVLASAGNERVYTAIATLRKMGLRDALVQRHDGYLLDPALAVVWS